MRSRSWRCSYPAGKARAWTTRSSTPVTGDRPAKTSESADPQRLFSLRCELGTSLRVGLVRMICATRSFVALARFACWVDRVGSRGVTFAYAVTRGAALLASGPRYAILINAPQSD